MKTDADFRASIDQVIYEEILHSKFNWKYYFISSDTYVKLLGLHISLILKTKMGHEVNWGRGG